VNSSKAVIPQSIRKLAWIALDILLVNAALLAAIYVRYAPDFVGEYLEHMRYVAPVTSALFVLVFYLSGMYRTMWQYISAADVLRILMTVLGASLATYAFSLAANRFVLPENLFMLPSLVYLLLWLFSFVLVTTSRMIYRSLRMRERFSLWKPLHTKVRRTMVIGAGWTGARVVIDMQNGRYGDCVPVLVVDDDERRTGRQLSGVPVVRGTGNIIKLASDTQIDDIIIAIATPRSDLRPLIEKCLATGCRVRKVTSLQDINESDGIARVTDLNINDLLGRPEEQLEMTAAAEFFRNRTILITGGGGSIGSELCRKLLPLQPERIVLYDISENYMYDLFNELKMKYGDQLSDKLILCVGSVRDEARLDDVFARYQPQVVLHAAAHKHVPLMEDCPDQAIRNNVLGTWLTAQTAIRHGVKRFVLISTDKAVNPTNVMGATKRLAEMIIEALNANSGTEFTAVRFGNVLGSHGSVVPLFERQIRAGGPVTLTHPEIIRFFMSIPEAASLVLQAASIAKGGELFVLDMGQPVRIRDLAERMIQLYTQNDNRRIEIVYTGLRPGEKLYEELMLAGEGIAKTENEKIFIAKPEVISMEKLHGMLERLQTCLDEKGDALKCLHELVPTFREAQQVNREAQVQKAV